MDHNIMAHVLDNSVASLDRDDDVVSRLLGAKFTPREIAASMNAAMDRARALRAARAYNNVAAALATTRGQRQ